LKVVVLRIKTEIVEKNYLRADSASPT
jgi:hypothetical protein